jgi:hypothetical protein
MSNDKALIPVWTLATGDVQVPPFADVSATLEDEADATAENEATGSWFQSAWFWVLMLGRLSMPRPRRR